MTTCLCYNISIVIKSVSQIEDYEPARRGVAPDWMAIKSDDPWDDYTPENNPSCNGYDKCLRCLGENVLRTIWPYQPKRAEGDHNATRSLPQQAISAILKTSRYQRQ